MYLGPHGYYVQQHAWESIIAAQANSEIMQARRHAEARAAAGPEIVPHSRWPEYVRALEARPRHWKPESRE